MTFFTKRTKDLGEGGVALSFFNKLQKRAKKEEKLAELNSEFLRQMKQKKQDGTLKQVWKDWVWILAYTKKYKGAVAFYIITGILSSTFSLVSAVASKYSIDIITSYQVSKLWLVVLIMASSMVISLILNSVTNRISTRLSIDINNDIQTEIFEKVADSDWMALNGFSNGDLINRFNSDIGAVANNAINWLPTLVVSLYQFIATFCVIWYYSPIMALIALSSAPLLLIFSKVILKKQRSMYQGVRKGSSQVMSYEVEAFYNFDTIKSFGITGLYVRKLKEKLKTYRNEQLDYNKFSIFSNAVLSVLSFLVELAAFGYCLFLLWSHQITYGTMTLFLQQRSSLTSSFNKVISIIPTILTASVSAARVRELLDLPDEIHSSVDLLDEHENTVGKDGLRVAMNNVNFEYEPGKPVLTDSNFQANPGQIIAVVGPSGEGKTTLIRMILGLVHPQHGKAYLEDWASGKRFPMSAETRAFYSYVPQGNTILSGTVAENLRMVKEEATDEEIETALKQACAWEFVSKLKDGINSPLGEKGKGVSEGQAQRIAIARAILRDAPVLLLDEATSALDVATERKVLRNIIQCRPDKTIIITTHRPSVLNMCERVYRIVDQQIVQLTEEESARMAMDF